MQNRITETSPRYLVGVTIGGLYTWSVIVGLCIAVILWLASLYLLVKVRRVLHLIQQPPAGGRSVV